MTQKHPDSARQRKSARLTGRLALGNLGAVAVTAVATVAGLGAAERLREERRRDEIFRRQLADLGYVPGPPEGDAQAGPGLHLSGGYVIGNPGTLTAGQVNQAFGYRRSGDALGLDLSRLSAEDPFEDEARAEWDDECRMELEAEARLAQGDQPDEPDPDQADAERGITGDFIGWNRPYRHAGRVVGVCHPKDAAYAWMSRLQAGALCIGTADLAECCRFLMAAGETIDELWLSSDYVADLPGLVASQGQIALALHGTCLKVVDPASFEPLPQYAQALAERLAQRCPGIRASA